ncbi:MAG: hypothetical protein JW697_03550 [Kosmotogaceae bacterium]|nr:hypothetical protein [Kosmotogaceae bacterium]
MKRLLLFLSVVLIILLGSSCLYVISVPIPISEELIEPFEFELPRSIVPLSYFAFGTETVPSLDEIIQEAEKEIQLNLPDNFVITGMEIKARVDWVPENPDSEDSIDIDFYVFRERHSEEEFLAFFNNPDPISDRKLFSGMIYPGENTFRLHSSESAALDMILEIINGGTAEDIDWFAIYDYEAHSESTITIHLSGTIWVKRVVE